MKRMKTKIILLFTFLVAAGMTISCDENESLPPFQTVGTATSTVASITASKTNPAPGENVKLTLRYVNLGSDPIQQVVLKAKVGAGAYADVQTFNESSAAVEEEIVHEVDVVAPATTATTVVYDMVLTSGKEFPQIRRVQIRTTN